MNVIGRFTVTSHAESRGRLRRDWLAEGEVGGHLPCVYALQ